MVDTKKLINPEERPDRAPQRILISNDLDDRLVDYDDSSRLDPAMCPPSCCGGTAKGYLITGLIAAAIGAAVLLGVHYYKEHAETQDRHQTPYETRQP